MTEFLARTVVVLAAIYLLALGTAALFAPARASRFLLAFAGSARVHFLELAVRLLVGASLVALAPQMWAAGAVSVLGWVLLVTTAVLLLVPWRWHHRFARQAVPRALRYLPLLGIGSLVLGGLLLAATLFGSSA